MRVRSCSCAYMRRAYVLLAVGVLRHELQQPVLRHVEGPADVHRLDGAAQLVVYLKVCVFFSD